MLFLQWNSEVCMVIVFWNTAALPLSFPIPPLHLLAILLQTSPSSWYLFIVDYICYVYASEVCVCV